MVGTVAGLQYVVRAGADRVPDSSRLRERLWVPGPDGDMFYNMRYHWGFLQVSILLQQLYTAFSETLKTELLKESGFSFS